MLAKDSRSMCHLFHDVVQRCGTKYTHKIINYVILPVIKRKTESDLSAPIDSYEMNCGVYIIVLNIKLIFDVPL